MILGAASIIVFSKYLLLFSGDCASSVCSGGSEQLSETDMADAIKIKEEIQKTGMYFA